MRVSTILRRQRAITERTTGIFASAHYRHQSHAQILARVSEGVYKRADYAALPHYARERIAGAIEGQFQAIEFALEWRLYLPGVGYVNSHSGVPDGRWADVAAAANRYPGRSVWRDAPESIYSQPDPSTDPEPYGSRVRAELARTFPPQIWHPYPDGIRMVRSTGGPAFIEETVTDGLQWATYLNGYLSVVSQFPPAL